MHVHWGLLVLCCGCGRIGFDAVTADAPGAFSAATPIVELNGPANDDDVSLTGDLREIFFMSDRSGSDRLYTASRATPADPWSAPVWVMELSGTENANNPRVTPDGLTIYFSSTRAPSAMFDLWYSTRPDRASAWLPPTRIAELGGPLDEFEPWVSERGLAIYFTARTPAGDADLTVAMRASTAEPFGAPVTLDAISSPVYDGSPWVDATDRVMIFHSGRGGGGISDLYTATRATTAEPFGVPVLFEGFNSPANDEDPWLSPDGSTFVFVSDRDGSNDFYIATR